MNKFQFENLTKLTYDKIQKIINHFEIITYFITKDSNATTKEKVFSQEATKLLNTIHIWKKNKKEVIPNINFIKDKYNYFASKYANEYFSEDEFFKWIEEKEKLKKEKLEKYNRLKIYFINNSKDISQYNIETIENIDEADYIFINLNNIKGDDIIKLGMFVNNKKTKIYGNNIFNNSFINESKIFENFEKLYQKVKRN